MAMVTLYNYQTYVVTIAFCFLLGGEERDNRNRWNITISTSFPRSVFSFVFILEDIFYFIFSTYEEKMDTSKMDLCV